MNLKSNIIEKAKNKKKPIWLMRQAGRYMNDYMEVRKNCKNFLELCYNPDLASDVTMQPIKRFNFDAAIVFSDILVIPDAMKRNVKFIESVGPVLDPIEDVLKIDELKINFEKLQPVYEAIKLTRKRLSKEKDLIGFAGSPWTIASYMLQGSGSKDFIKAKHFAFNNKKKFIKLIEILIESISEHLIRQIESGCNVVKLFDSWCSVLPEEYFKEFVINANEKIAKKVKDKHPDVKIIIFPRSCGVFYEEFANLEVFDVLALDQLLTTEYINTKLSKKIIQGNLDPAYLLCNIDILDEEIDRILDKIGGNNLIFNLSHGVNKESKEENIEFLVRKLR